MIRGIKLKSVHTAMQMCEISTEFVLDRFLFHWANSQVTNQYSYDDICHFYKAPSQTPSMLQAFYILSRGHGLVNSTLTQCTPDRIFPVFHWRGLNVTAWWAFCCSIWDASKTFQTQTTVLHRTRTSTVYREKIRCRVAAPALLMHRVAIDLLYTEWASPLKTPSVRSYGNVRSPNV